MSRRKNTFSKAIKHLKESPTNSTTGVYSAVPGTNSITTVIPGPTIPDESTIDWVIDGPNGTDTSGLFDGAGNHKLISPPGDNSYILGPMVSMYYTYASPHWTRIGYIRESDRRMVNLGTITGTIEDWDGETGFSSYGQLTLEQAAWFKHTPKKPDGYRAFYPGPPSSSPDVFGRYYCTITGTPLAMVDTTVTTTVSPIDLQPEAVFAAIMDRKSKGKKLSKAEEEWLEKHGKDNIFDRLKGVFTGKGLLTGKSIGEKLEDIKDFFGDYLTPPAAEYSTNIAKSILQNKPITVKQEDIPQGDIDKFVNVLANNHYAHSIPVSFGEPKPYSDENFYFDEDGKIHSNIGPNGEKGYYQKGQTQSFKVPGGKLSFGYTNPLAAAGEAQVQFVYPTDGSEPYLQYTDHAYHNIESDDPGEVPDPIKTVFSGLVHAFAGHTYTKSTGSTKELAFDTKTPNTGAMSGYDPTIRGDVKTEIKVPLSKLPKSLQDRAAFEKNYEQNVKPKYKDIERVNQSNSYKSQGTFLTEKRKLSILNSLKEPVVIPETKQKSYKVRPGRRGKTNFQGMDKLVGDIKPQESFKKPQDIWSDGWQGHNARLSQDKKNIVLEKIGEGKQAWEYMLKYGTKMDAKNLEEFWGKNPDLYSYYSLGGKKYRPIRKEQVRGDYLVFLVDEVGKTSSMLQSELNEKLSEESDKEMLAEYNKTNEPIPFLDDPLVRRVAKRLKSQIDYPDKPAVKGYPNEAPPKMDKGWHPELGKRYKYDKLDPVSAIAMRNAPTGDQEIDDNVKKSSVKPKVAEDKKENWRDSLTNA